ncbi:MAG: lipid-A-disaccharide synthase [Hyphomonadaceae bacterium]
MRYFIVAAEASGDVLGADLIRALRTRDPEAVFAGVGAARMSDEGVASIVEIAKLSVLGIVDTWKAYPRAVRAADDTAAAAVEFKPDVAVLIDSWGFTIRVAQRLRRMLPGVPLVKYIGPQVWATRPERAKQLAETVDHLICMHDFEVPFYAPHGLACTVCGHPAIGRYTPGDGAGFRARHGIKNDQPLLLVLPGSRRSEVRRIAPTLWAAAERLQAQIPDLRVMSVAAGSVAPLVRLETPSFVKIVAEDEKDDAFAAATAAIACSGTVTTEVALQGAPIIAGYRVGWFTWVLARLFFYRAPFMTLLNVAAQREVAPEFIQTRFTAEIVAAAAAPLLTDATVRAAQVDAQNEALQKMGRGGRPASEIAADAVMQALRRA